LLALVTVALIAPAARAQSDGDKKQAQALQVEGVRLMHKGNNRGALSKFEEAFRLVPSPKILFNRGKAHFALGDAAEALSDLERFLDEAPYAPEESRAEAERTIQSLRPKLSYIEVQTDDVGSRVSIDGKEMGAAPLPRPVVVAPGAHEVRVDKTGMNSETRSVSPIAGQKVRVAVKLVPVPERPSPATNIGSLIPTPVPPTAGAPATSAIPPRLTGGPTPAESPAPSPSGAGRWQITAAWISGGAGVLLLGGGVTLQLLSASKNADFNNTKLTPTAANTKGQCNQALMDSGGGPCQALLDAANRRHTYALVGVAAGGAALIGALVFYLAAPPANGGAREVAAACLPMVGGATGGDRAGASCALALRF
jgi:hypothetical protein